MNKNILVIEDEEVLNTIVERAFRAINPSVRFTWVRTASEAQRELRKQHFDLILSDLRLEGTQTGLDVWRFCKEKFPKTPFVIMSAISVDAFLRITSVYRESPKFLPKPFYATECIELLADSLKPEKQAC